MKAPRTLADVRDLARSLPGGDDRAASAVAERQSRLTKPPGSLGRLEEFVAWLARWQGRPMPRLDSVHVLVFAGNHGVSVRGVSAFPASVTAQMVANFAAGGAAICQLCAVAGATLAVTPLRLDEPTEDMTVASAMDEAAFVEAFAAGFAAVPDGADLVCLGEMGIANTTAASALAAALFGGDGGDWAGRGTGIDDAGLARKRAAIDASLALHAAMVRDPLGAARAVGGRELAAILGAALAARHKRVPVLLDGFVSTAAAAPLARLAADGLAHTQVAHVSAEAGHRRLAAALGAVPLLDLGMRLGEASGAAVAVLVLRAALACHTGMATFAEAGVDDRA